MVSGRLTKKNSGYEFNNFKFNLLTGTLLLILSFGMFLPLASALEIDMKSEYDSGETLLAVLSGNFIDIITPSDILFYRGHVQVPVNFDIVKQGENFYLYALLTDKTEGNYSFEISNVRYYRGTNIVDDIIVKPFVISNVSFQFSINPGFIITDENFSVKLKNLQERKISVNLETSEEIVSVKSIELKEGEEKTLDIKLGNPLEKEILIFSSEGDYYEFPSFITSGRDIIEEKNYGFDFEQKKIDISMAINSEGKRVIYLENLGDIDIENIELELSDALKDYVKLSSYETDLNKNESEKIEIIINSGSEEEIIEGEIGAMAVIETETGNKTIISSVTLILNFIKDFISEDGQTEEFPSIKSCSEVGGEFCSENAECDGNIFYASDGVCCLGICNEVEENFGKKWVGWGLLIVLVLGIFWFYKRKYKRV